jgi:hypothetical protein
MPDPQRPSRAPLSESEADRLSERFTASWEDPDLASEPAAVSAIVASPAPSAAPSTTTPLPPIKPQPTLLGIAPVVVGPATPPPAPLPAPSAPPSAIPPPPPSSPESSVARGLTTPSKRYIPKDDPSTPAVVISDAALHPPAQASPNRARIAQTLPGQTRSSPLAAPPPAPPSSASNAVEDTYPPLRAGRSKLPLVLGGAALLCVAALGVAKLGGGRTSRVDSSSASPSPSPLSSSPAAREPVAAPPPTPETPAAAEPAPTPAAPPEPTQATVPAVPSTKAPKALKKSAASLTAPRKATKPETKSDSKPSAAEPGASKKGVIVRETPF